MLKFFGSIRYNLIETEKTSKYLKYGVGEIILVVIGILIALQINNWNENRKNKHQEKEFLIALKETLNRDLDRNLESQNINQKALHSMRVIEKHMAQDLPYHDSLKHHFGGATNFQFWDLSESVFKSLEATGLDLISNDDLRDSLALAYGNHNKFINFAGFRYHDYMDHAILNIFNKHFDMAWGNPKLPPFKTVMIPLDYESLKSDKEFKYFLKTLPNLHYYKLIWPLESTEQLLKRLLFLIDKELEKFN